MAFPSNNKIKAEKEITRLRNLLARIDGATISQITTKQYNYEFSVARGSDKVKVLVYFGKKGVKHVLQGNAESALYKKIEEFVFGQSSLFSNNEELTLPEKYIGSDESGKGDFFGPLAVAAFFVDKNTASRISRLGIRDSKELSDNQIMKLTHALRNEFEEYFSVYTLEPEEYNKKYAELGNNLNKLLVYAHSKAVKPLIQKFDVKYVITDKFSNRALTLENEFADVKFVQETKAEKYLAVAAASVLARAEVIEWFEKINMTLAEKANITLPKGASAEVDAAAQALAKKYSKEDLSRICKTHFKNFSKIR